MYIIPLIQGRYYGRNSGYERKLKGSRDNISLKTKNLIRPIVK
jgi:hypothetical protein